MNLTKEEKKALLNAYKEKQNKKYSLRKRDVKSLFAYISKELAKSGCDHTLRHTEEWLKSARIKRFASGYWKRFVKTGVTAIAK